MDPWRGLQAGFVRRFARGSAACFDDLRPLASRRGCSHGATPSRGRLAPRAFAVRTTGLLGRDHWASPSRPRACSVETTGLHRRDHGLARSRRRACSVETTSLLGRDHRASPSRPRACSVETTGLHRRDQGLARSRPPGFTVVTSGPLGRDHAPARSRPRACSVRTTALRGRDHAPARSIPPGFCCSHLQMARSDCLWTSRSNSPISHPTTTSHRAAGHGISTSFPRTWRSSNSR